jgi:hypothetical protein
MSKHMVSKICTKIHSEFIYATKYYPHEHESGERSPNIKVWKRGHRGSNPSQLGQLCTSEVQAQLVSCSITLIGSSQILVLSADIYDFLCFAGKGMLMKSPRNIVKATTKRTSRLIASCVCH